LHQIRDFSFIIADYDHKIKLAQDRIESNSLLKQWIFALFKSLPLVLQCDLLSFDELLIISIQIYPENV